jgi:hypothetical protein
LFAQLRNSVGGGRRSTQVVCQKKMTAGQAQAMKGTVFASPCA